MTSPEAQAHKEFLKQAREAMAGNNHVPTLEEQRAGAYWMLHRATMPDGVTIREAYAGGCRAYWHDPAERAVDRVILYLHGGEYVVGSPRTHERLVSHLAVATGCRALNLDYRLAPEHPFPAAVEDATAAYRWLLEQGYAPEHIVLSGDSAGGGLVLGALLALAEQGLPQPAAAVPMSPLTDLEATGESMTTNSEADLMVNGDSVRRGAAAFVGGGDLREPLAAPLHGEYAGVAPLYFQVGSDETLLDDSTRVAEKARAAGVEVKLDVFPEMQHIFQMCVGNVPEATDAVQRIGGWLRPRLGL